ncbi:ribonuclease Z [soil metagenome]
MLAVTILGNNSAIPAFDRHPTSQTVQNVDQVFLIDCGEGTQMQMQRYKIRHSKINHIFISHLHGDHYFGLIGLLTSMGLSGRKNDVHLYATAELRSIIFLQLYVAQAHLAFELIFHPLDTEGILYEDKNISVECFHVYHRIPCWGFLFREKKIARTIITENVLKYNIPITYYKDLQAGADYIDANNAIVKNDELTLPHQPGKSYAYCGDTLFNKTVADKVRGVDLLYHESTFLHEMQEKAAQRFHSTTKEAAMIAKLAGVNKLLLGHFSSRYETLDQFKNEACEVFPNTELALEGSCYTIS